MSVVLEKAEGLAAKHVDITVSAASGDQTIVAAVPGKQIKVMGYVFVTDTGSAFTWKSATTAISGVMTLAANGGVSTTPSKWGYMITTAGEALVLNVGTSATVGGHVTYIEI